MKHRKFIAVLMMALCLIGTMPFLSSAFSPVLEGATYTLQDPNLLPITSQTSTSLTPIDAQLNYYTCSGSPNIPGTVSADIFDSEIFEIGFFENSVILRGKLRAMAYIPALSSIPLYFDGALCTSYFFIDPTNDKLVVSCKFDDEEETFYFYPNSEITITLLEILDTTDISILNTTLIAFSTSLTTEQYGNWILGGYNSIVDVFINNAKIQYVMDNPIFIIALVVFAMSISYAVATFIFKILRRY